MFEIQTKTTERSVMLKMQKPHAQDAQTLWSKCTNIAIDMRKYTKLMLKMQKHYLCVF